MEAPATYVHFWFILISVPNLLIIGAMIVLFVLALVVPFPRHRSVAKPTTATTPLTDTSGQPPAPASATPDEAGGNWTRGVREGVSRRWPWQQLLPDKQPRYVASWVYMFGVAAIAALVWIVISGLILVFFGPTWWHVSSTGKFVNSIHFWSVQLFFGFLVLHLWGQFFMAGWRHGRALTWIVGVGIFAIAIGTAFTGYLTQQNLDAQWIALNGKDAINGTGLGAFFNILDYGQMFGIHVMLLPLGVISLVIVHILLIRLRGVVLPIGWPERFMRNAHTEERES
jgi:quinol-cytochrome oxidoreductase complex cytochrome b subunit